MIDLFNAYKEKLISKFEVPEEKFNRDFNEWVIRRGITVQSKNDFIWSVLNRLVFEAPSKAGQLEKTLRPLYFEMWSFLIKEEKKASHVLKQMLYCDLVLADNDTYRIRANLITKCCVECDKHQGEVMPLDQALLKQPLPFPECTRNRGCICSYGFRLERDSNGNPISKK